MNNELIVFTHNDLDALGCMLNLEFKFPTIRKKYFHTNYSNIDQVVDEIEQYQMRNDNSHIVIPDVSFSDNKAALKRLYNLFDKVTHIDHHRYPEDFWDEFPNMKVVWDHEKSATLLCNEYLGNKGKNSNLDKLSYLIDTYDIWQKDRPAFKVSQDLNNYFWECDINWLLDEIIRLDFNLPNNFKSVVDNFNIRCEKTLRSYENKNLIHRAGEITVFFGQEFFNELMIREHESGKNFVIGVNSWGIVKIRINQDAPYTEETIKKIKHELVNAEEYGHLHAFTYKLPNNGFDKLMQEIKNIIETIERICNG